MHKAKLTERRRCSLEALNSREEKFFHECKKRPFHDVIRYLKGMPLKTDWVS